MMAEITPVSVEFAAAAIRHLDDRYGARVAGPALTGVMDFLGRAEALYQTLPRVHEERAKREYDPGPRDGTPPGPH